MVTDSQSEAASIKVDLVIKSQSQDDSIDNKSIFDIHEIGNSEAHLQKILNE